jgi:ABC-type transporter Mla subunit MlaD
MNTTLSAALRRLAAEVWSGATRARLLRLADEAAELEHDIRRADELLDYAVAASAEIERAAEMAERPAGCSGKLRVIAGGRA